MAMDFGDPGIGFHHREVVEFINEEVRCNGGGPDFYVAFRSRPWNEVEDRLLTVVANPQVPRALKRACTWSALALSVRVGAREREQQTCWLRQLQKQVEEREGAAWALASELQRLREEREDMASQLRGARDHLQQALSERELLRGQLIQAERWAQTHQAPWEAVPRPPGGQLGPETWAMGAGEHNTALDPEVQCGQDGNAQVGANATGMFYVPGPPNPWVQVVQPPPPVLLPTPCPVGPPVAPMAFPCHPPPPEAAGGAAYPPQMPLGVAGLPTEWPAATQEHMAPQWNQRNQGQRECSVRPHVMHPSEQNWNPGDSGEQDLQGQRSTVPTGKTTFEPLQEEKLAPDLRRRG
ncbi:testis-expressed protein 13D-like [Erinaceus europaeus]|uniref:Testis-expressed protein 13D-like n=1 Tax=Erinaceus europaeus TaxID=9365 RepID=A0ABM3WPY6_ERIEU|nr:testis-expressed protein 13D-like [Erinaceus europaeus]